MAEKIETQPPSENPKNDREGLTAFPIRPEDENSAWEMVRGARQQFKEGSKIVKIGQMEYTPEDIDRIHRTLILQMAEQGKKSQEERD